MSVNTYDNGIVVGFIGGKDYVSKGNDDGTHSLICPIGDAPEIKKNHDRMAEEIAELKGAIEAAVRIKELWLPMGAFSDSPPEHYAEIEALHKMANKFEKALVKLSQEGKE